MRGKGDEVLFARAGADVVMVPSRGEPQAISDLMAGNVDFYFGNTSVLLAQKDHPAIKLLAVGTAQRVASAPEIPTVSETVPGFVFASWNGFFVPNGTPEDIVEKLRGATTEMVKEPQMAARLTSLGILPGGQNKEQVAAAFKIILGDPNVKGILVNIFGGIMDCNVIAQGIIAAAQETSLSIPLVVRLEGNNVAAGKATLAASGLAITGADDLDDAAKKIVAALK